MIKLKNAKGKRIHKSIRSQPNLVFSLRKNRKQDQFDPIYIDFSLIFHPSLENFQKFLPKYRKDYCPFTPAFIFQGINQNPLQNLQVCSFDQIQKQQTQISITRPQPDCMMKICCVCRRQYDEYFSHIQSDSHKFCLRNSKYQQEIKQFCKSYNGKQNMRPQNDCEQLGEKACMLPKQIYYH